jgi:hypothetical protein
LCGSETEFEKPVYFFHEAKVVAEDVGERELIEVLAVEAQMA